MVSTSARIASTGARLRPTTCQMTHPRTKRSSGMPPTSTLTTASPVSVTLSSDLPTTTNIRPSPVEAHAETARNVSSSNGRSATLSGVPGSGRAITLLPARLSLAARTAPSGSRTCRNSSSSPTSGMVSPIDEPSASASPSATSSARSSAASRTSAVSERCRRMTIATPDAPSATPTRMTAAPVVRTRTLPHTAPARRRSHPLPRGGGRSSAERSATVCCQPVPRTAQGFDRAAAEWPVEFVAEMPYVDLDDVGITLEVVVPNVIKDVPFGQHVPLVPQKELEECHLPRRQAHLYLAPESASRAGVEPEISRLQHGGPGACPTADEGSEPRGQDERGERFR